MQDFPDVSRVFGGDTEQVLIQGLWDLKLGRDLKKINAVRKYFLETVWPLHDHPPPQHPRPQSITSPVPGYGVVALPTLVGMCINHFTTGSDTAGTRGVGIVAGDYFTTNVARVLIEKDFFEGGVREKGWEWILDGSIGRGSGDGGGRPCWLCF